MNKHYFYKYKGFDSKEKGYKYYIYQGSSYIGTFWCLNSQDVEKHIANLKYSNEKTIG